MRIVTALLISVIAFQVQNAPASTVVDCAYTYAAKSRQYQKIAVGVGVGTAVVAAGSFLAADKLGWLPLLRGEFLNLLPLVPPLATLATAVDYGDESRFLLRQAKVLVEVHNGRPGPSAEAMAQTINAVVYRRSKREFRVAADTQAPVFAAAMDWRPLSGADILALTRQMIEAGQICSEPKPVVKKYPWSRLLPKALRQLRSSSVF